MNSLFATKFLVVPVLVFLIVSLAPLSVYARGKFEGRVIVEWLIQSPERDMKLLEPFAFRDGRGKLWSVPVGAIINGASIPQVAWSAAGSPYTGSYRRASVVHDYYCETKTESWESVHRMFFDAMIAGGVGEVQAKTFYAFVYAGGPRWKSFKTKNLDGHDEKITVQLVASISPEIQNDATAWIKATNPSVEMIEKRLDSAIVVR
jgi:Protein of unknown function (DUF1353)